MTCSILFQPPPKPFSASSRNTWVPHAPLSCLFPDLCSHASFYLDYPFFFEIIFSSLFSWIFCQGPPPAAFPSESRCQFSNIQEYPLFTSGAGLLRFHCNGLFMHLALPLDWEFPEYLRPQDWHRAEWGLFPCITSFLNYTIIVSILIIVLASAFVRESS